MSQSVGGSPEQLFDMFPNVEPGVIMAVWRNIPDVPEKFDRCMDALLLMDSESGGNPGGGGGNPWGPGGGGSSTSGPASSSSTSSQNVQAAFRPAPASSPPPVLMPSSRPSQSSSQNPSAFISPTMNPPQPPPGQNFLFRPSGAPPQSFSSQLPVTQSPTIPTTGPTFSTLSPMAPNPPNNYNNFNNRFSSPASGGSGLYPSVPNAFGSGAGTGLTSPSLTSPGTFSSSPMLTSPARNTAAAPTYLFPPAAPIAPSSAAPLAPSTSAISTSSSSTSGSQQPPAPQTNSGHTLNVPMPTGSGAPQRSHSSPPAGVAVPAAAAQTENAVSSDNEGEGHHSSRPPKKKGGWFFGLFGGHHESDNDETASAEPAQTTVPPKAARRKTSSPTPAVPVSSGSSGKVGESGSTSTSGASPAPPAPAALTVPQQHPSVVLHPSPFGPKPTSSSGSFSAENGPRSYQNDQRVANWEQLQATTQQLDNQSKAEFSQLMESFMPKHIPLDTFPRLGSSTALPKSDPAIKLEAQVGFDNLLESYISKAAPACLSVEESAELPTRLEPAIKLTSENPTEFGNMFDRFYAKELVKQVQQQQDPAENEGSVSTGIAGLSNERRSSYDALGGSFRTGGGSGGAAGEFSDPQFNNLMQKFMAQQQFGAPA